MVPIEIIQLSDLQVNITHHKMVPKHSVLGDEDTKELLDKYRIKKH
jgi:DNA-directed RNA polymerase I, II, and III subunit RPABC1